MTYLKRHIAEPIQAPVHASMQKKPASFVVYDEINTAVETLMNLSKKASEIEVIHEGSKVSLSTLWHPVEAAADRMKAAYAADNTPIARQDLPPYISENVALKELPAEVSSQPGVSDFLKTCEDGITQMQQVCKKLSEIPIYQPDLITKRPDNVSVQGFHHVVYGGSSAFLPKLLTLLMPDPNVKANETTGLSQKQFVTSQGQSIYFRSQSDLESFMEIARTDKVNVEPKLREGDISPEDAKAAKAEIEASLRGGTGVREVAFSSKTPQDTAAYFACKNADQGFVKGSTDHHIRTSESANMDFCFTLEEDQTPNPNSVARKLDHMVVNGLASNSKTHLTLLPHCYWGGAPEDLRYVAKDAQSGVQFNTGVFGVEDSQGVMPFNHLHPLEEVMARLCIQGHKESLPAHLREPVLKNQITKGWLDNNPIDPEGKGDPFLQHLAIGLGEGIFEAVNKIRANEDDPTIPHNSEILPRPDDQYYIDTEAVMCERAILLPLLQATGVEFDPNQLPKPLFEALLQPSKADEAHIKALLAPMGEEMANAFVEGLKKLKPVLTVISNFVRKQESIVEGQLSELLRDTLRQHECPEISNPEEIAHIILTNRLDVNRAKVAGLLIDYNPDPDKNNGGTIYQSFTSAAGQTAENRFNTFNEMIYRRCPNEIEVDRKKGHDAPVTRTQVVPTKEEAQAQKVLRKEAQDENGSFCGLFGQGNFAKLMEFMQRLMLSKQDEAEKAVQGNAAANAAAEAPPKTPFTWPLMTKAEIAKDPFKKMNEIAVEKRAEGLNDVATALETCIENLKQVFEAASAA